MSSWNESVEPRADPENSGAGGSGRLGLPPYVDAGVPGLGLPLISAGSYLLEIGGGREYSCEDREGVQGLLGELSKPELYETYDEVSGGGRMGGSRIDDRESSEGS